MQTPQCSNIETGHDPFSRSQIELLIHQLDPVGNAKWDDFIVEIVLRGVQPVVAAVSAHAVADTDESARLGVEHEGKVLPARRATSYKFDGTSTHDSRCGCDADFALCLMVDQGNATPADVRLRTRTVHRGKLLGKLADAPIDQLLYRRLEISSGAADLEN